MADVSVRLQGEAGTEIVLNLSLLQAIRLVEAIAGRAADTISQRVGLQGDTRWLSDARQPSDRSLAAAPVGPATTG